ncbi:hypothetical protein ACP4OV_005037 [Aristida adscensionis]
MSGVWVFKNGQVRLVDVKGDGQEAKRAGKRKALVYMASGEIISSYAALEAKLTALGWERYYYEDPDLLQFHRRGSLELISLPADYARFSSVHMYDILVKNRDAFRVVDRDHPAYRG